jgi:predicted nucleotide-binding protein
MTNISDQPTQEEPRLKVQREEVAGILVDRIAFASRLMQYEPATFDLIGEIWDEFIIWDDYNKAYLRRAFSTPQISRDYESNLGCTGGTVNGYWQQVRSLIQTQRQKLRSIQARLELIELTGDEAPVNLNREPKQFGDDIFIVHGHDGAMKAEVEKFVERCVNATPIILHDKPDKGRTIIEKFESHAGDARFAIVLLTGDDQGKEKSTEVLSLRARQNVVFEHGFFIGMLGRENVLALYADDIELPSDLSGVLYKPISGNWHTELATELRAAGFTVDLTKLR